MSRWDEEWRLAESDSDAAPSHVYAGVKLVATVFCRSSARKIVAAHNASLAKKAAKPVPPVDRVEDESWLIGLPALLEREIDLTIESIFDSGQLADLAASCCMAFYRDRSQSYVPRFGEFYRQVANASSSEDDVYSLIMNGDVEIAPIIEAVIDGVKHSWTPLSQHKARLLHEAIMEAAPTWSWVKETHQKDIEAHERNNFQLTI